MKIKVDRCYRVTDEDHNVIMSFVVSGYERRIAEMAIDEAKKFTVIELETKERKSKRSIDQNAMLWVLLTKLALASAHDKSPDMVNQMYCAMLEQANVLSEYIIAPEGAEEGLKKAFRAVRKIGEREINGKRGIMYQVWIGSSKFTTKEMTDLIEATLDKLAEFGIYDEETERIRYETQVNKGNRHIDESQADSLGA